MASSFIPQRIKRAKQQITVKLYQDQLAMLDKYGRFIDDSRDYIISQALELVFKRDKEFARWVELDRNAGSSAERTLTRTESAGSASPSGPQGMREESVLAQKSWARSRQNQHRPVEDRVVRRAVESRNLVSFVVSAAVGLYLFATGRFRLKTICCKWCCFRSRICSTESSMALLLCCFQHRTSHSRSYSHLHTFLLCGEKSKLGPGGSHHIFRQKVVTIFTW